MLREITISGERYDMNRFGVVQRYQTGGWLFGTHVPATSAERHAVHEWASERGATVIGTDRRGDRVWDLKSARKALREIAAGEAVQMKAGSTAR
jgi:hypothetical protein